MKQDKRMMTAESDFAPTSAEICDVEASFFIMGLQDIVRSERQRECELWEELKIAV